jgi:ABC-type antimicrobial peptide transport system permease subunit
MYIPNAQTPDALNVLNLRISPLVWVVRTKSSTAGLSGQIQEQIRQASGLPISDVRNMEEVISRSTSRERFNMLLMTVFGGAALVLAAIGVYGLMAYSVQQRSQEIGIRMALGAQRGDVREMVVKEGMRFALLGVALGTAGALALARYMSAFLYGVEARDPLVFVAIPLVLAFTALVAVWIPAQRATHVDPVLALRGD